MGDPEQVRPLAATSAPGGTWDGATPGAGDGPPWWQTARGRGFLLLAVLYLVAFVPRAALALRAGDAPFAPSSDAGLFFQEAQDLAAGRGLVRHFQPTGEVQPSAFHMPGAALWYALAVALFGPSPLAARLAAAAASSASAPLVYGLARSMMPRGWAILAGLVCAFYPTWVYFSAEVLTEPLYVPLVLAAALLTVRALERPAFARTLVAGLGWGVAGLVRPHAYPIAALLALYFAWSSRSWRAPAAILLGAVLVLVPWWARNVAVFGHFVPFSTEAGETLLGANNPHVLADPRMRGVWMAPIAVPEYRAAMFRTRNEVELNAVWQGMALDYLRANPEAIPRLVYYKLARWLTPVMASGGANRLIVLASYGPLLVLVLAGFATGRLRYTHALVPALALTIADVVIVAVYWGNLTRGRLDLEVMWIAFAVQAFRLLLWEPLRRGRATPRPTDAVV